MDNRVFIPKDKFDVAAVERLALACSEQIIGIERPLLEWIADMNWHYTIAGFYIVDYNYSDVSKNCSTIEDEVTLFALIPVKATTKGYTSQPLEKLKLKKWKGLELNI